jgi:citrate lyase beta subunit
MVHLNFKDLDSLRHEAMEAADMGFAGKQGNLVLLPVTYHQ